MLEKDSKVLVMFATGIFSFFTGLAIFAENLLHFISRVGLWNTVTVIEVIVSMSAIRYFTFLASIILVFKGLYWMKNYWNTSIVEEYRKIVFTGFLILILVGIAAGYMTLPSYETGETEQAAAHSYNEMGFEMIQTMQEMETDNTNIVMSPLSIGLAYSMLYEGSNTETQAELEEFLNIENMTTTQFQNSNQKLIQSLENPEPEYTHHRRLGLAKDVQTNLANGIWFREGSPINQQYQENMSTFYDAEITEAPMNQETEDEINQWVEQNTEGMIDEIIDDLESDTLAVLVNAVYFYGEWSESFDEDDTEEEEFTLKDGSTAQVPLMEKDETDQNFTAINHDWQHIEEPQRVQHEESTEEVMLQATRLPYGETERINMYILHPEDIDHLTNEINLENFLKVRESMEEQTIDLKIPKYEAEYDADLVNVTREMGLEKPYENQADLSDMSPAAEKVDEAVHEAVIEVDEEGTEAAAATAAMVLMSAPSHPQMVVDSPFMFMIFDEETESIMFQGVIEDPS